LIYTWAIYTVPDTIITTTADGVATVYLDGNRQQVAGGTGFFIDDGYGVLTNYHVIEKGKYFKAQSIVSGKTLSDGYVDDSNRACDLAVLRFRAYTNMYLDNTNDPALNLCQLFLAEDSSKMEEGDRVIVVGNPQGFLGTVVEGLISAIRMNGALCQISAPISPGSSGSPVFNEDGYVIGIATMMMANGQRMASEAQLQLLE
jgi:serine protease Do